MTAVKKVFLAAIALLLAGTAIAIPARAALVENGYNPLDLPTTIERAFIRGAELRNRRN